MVKRRVNQLTLALGLVAVMGLTLPGFLIGFGGIEQDGLVLVNGRIEGTEVAVGSKLPGRITSVLVSEGQEVEKGQLLATIDTAELEIALEGAQASVQQARHQLASAIQQVNGTDQELLMAQVALQLTEKRTELAIGQAQTAIKQAQARVQQARAMLHKAQTNFDHAKKLLNQDAATDLEFVYAQDSLDVQTAAVQIAKGQVEQAQQAHQVAVAEQLEVDIARHRLAGLEVAKQQALLAVSKAQASLDCAFASPKMIELQLEQAKLTAPCKGIVVTRVAEPGEVIAIGSVVAVLIDFDQLYLKGYLPNRLVGKVKLNDPARLHLDAFEGKSFQGKVHRIHQRAEFTPKNVDTPQQRIKLVFGIQIHVDNPDRLIKPGMPGDVVIRIDPAVSWKSPRELR